MSGWRGSPTGPRRRNRGQLVLVAAVALALALVSLSVAYLQLGYNEDTHAVDHEPAQQLEGVLDRTLHNASAGVPERYDWADRDDAVQAVGELLNQTIERLETSRLQDGHAYAITHNDTHATGWLSGNCPSGPDRQFGGCTSSDGIVVQERNGQTHVLAVAFDIVITTPDRAVTVTLTISGPQRHDT